MNTRPTTPRRPKREIPELCTCHLHRGGKLHLRRADCACDVLYTEEHCPHGADDTSSCVDCRRRSYYARLGRE